MSCETSLWDSSPDSAPSFKMATKEATDFYGSTPLGGIFRARSQNIGMLNASRGVGLSKSSLAYSQHRSQKGRDEIITTEAFPEISDDDDISMNSVSLDDQDCEGCPKAQIDDGRHGTPLWLPVQAISLSGWFRQ